MISRTIKEGFRGVGRHWAMSLSSAIAVTITLLIISLFMMFSANVRQFTQNVEQSVQIYAGIDYDYETPEKMADIKKAILEIDGVRQVTFYSKEEELEYWLDSFEDDQIREIYAPDDEYNPMHAAFYIETQEGKKLQAVAEQVGKIEGIYEVNYGGESTLSLVKAMASIRRGGLFLVLALSILAIFLIQNTIQLTIMAREDEIRIMQYVGANNRFIRLPFLMEGILIGLMGSVIPVAATIWGYMYIYKLTGGILISSMFRMVQPYPFVLWLAGILVVIGILVGLVGSFLSVTKRLRVQR